MKEHYLKPLKRSTLFFLPNPVPFNVQSYQNKRGLELVTSCFLGYESSLENFLYLLHIIWKVWWSNIKQLLSYFKNYICKFMHANSWHHKLFHFHLSFCIWKVWKGGEKIQKFEYLVNEKSFLDETKNTFHSFWTTII